jgi:hypothetical protein
MSDECGWLEGLDREDRDALRIDIVLDKGKIGPTPRLKLKLREIIELQFRSDTLGEVLGVVRSLKERQRSSLELEVVKTSEMEEVERAFKLFCDDDYSKLDVLIDYVKDAERTYRENGLVNYDLRAISTLYPFVKDLFDNKPQVFEGYMRDSKSYLVSVTGDLISSYVRGNVETNLAGLLAGFHCHKGGSPPSPIDIKTNLLHQLPELVISFTENYKEEGANIYLIHKGIVRIPYHIQLPKQ